MPTNLYLNNFPAKQITSEQLLIEDLVIESIQWAGMDVYYLPRSSRDEVDYLYGEDTLKAYLKAHPIEMYLEDFTGMEGEGDFISKFGLEIRDEITMLVSRRRFKTATSVSNLSHPREGDLIYMPLVQNFFEITFVEHENDQAMFYTLGRGRNNNVYVYLLKMKQYVFSNEIIETGIQEVDEQIVENYPRTTINLSANGSGVFAPTEVVYQGTNLESSSARAIVYSFDSRNTSNTLTMIRVQGVFASGAVKGANSGAVWTANISTMLAADLMEMENPFEDIMDNKKLEIEGEGIIDWTEKNPFGET